MSAGDTVLQHETVNRRGVGGQGVSRSCAVPQVKHVQLAVCPSSPPMWSHRLEDTRRREGRTTESWTAF